MSAEPDMFSTWKKIPNTPDDNAQTPHRGVCVERDDVPNGSLNLPEEISIVRLPGEIRGQSRGAEPTQ